MFLQCFPNLVLNVDGAPMEAHPTDPDFVSVLEALQQDDPPTFDRYMGAVNRAFEAYQRNGNQMPTDFDFALDADEDPSQFPPNFKQAPAFIAEGGLGSMAPVDDFADPSGSGLAAAAVDGGTTLNFGDPVMVEVVLREIDAEELKDEEHYADFVHSFPQDLAAVLEAHSSQFAFQNVHFTADGEPAVDFTIDPPNAALLQLEIDDEKHMEKMVRRCTPGALVKKVCLCVSSSSALTVLDWI